MLVRISSMALRISALLAFLLGMYRWISGGWINERLKDTHQLFGIIVMLALFGLSYAIFSSPKAKNPGLAIAGILVGILLLFVGLTQQNLLYLGNAQIVIQIVHLLLGIGAIGLGEVLAARYKRANNAA